MREWLWGHPWFCCIPHPTAGQQSIHLKAQTTDLLRKWWASTQTSSGVMQAVGIQRPTRADLMLAMWIRKIHPYSPQGGHVDLKAQPCGPHTGQVDSKAQSYSPHTGHVDLKNPPLCSSCWPWGILLTQPLPLFLFTASSLHCYSFYLPFPPALTTQQGFDCLRTHTLSSCYIPPPLCTLGALPLSQVSGEASESWLPSLPPIPSTSFPALHTI